MASVANTLELFICDSIQVALIDFSAVVTDEQHGLIN